jgi:protein phosphatase
VHAADTKVVRAYGISDKGRIRPTNEDHFVIDERLGLSVVADGMGGHNAGEVAARVAIDTIVDFIGRLGPSIAWPFGYDESLSEAGNRMRTAVHLANMRVLEAAGASSAYAGMATTIVAAQVVGDRLIVGHVGDSRVYLFTAHGLCLLTHDDSWISNVLAEDPAADPALLQHHPMRNALTNVVGARSRTDVHIVEVFLSGGELMLLTTDGVHGVLDDQRLEQLLVAGGSLEQTAESLVSAALVRGSRDNCTAVVAQYQAAE